ncbi:Adenylate cyclase 1 [Pelomyxa schiedti]|nr:Adenylate cyclase 1 [Pelomyxa schiedti]
MEPTSTQQAPQRLQQEQQEQLPQQQNEMCSAGVLVEVAGSNLGTFRKDNEHLVGLCDSGVLVRNFVSKAVIDSRRSSANSLLFQHIPSKDHHTDPHISHLKDQSLRGSRCNSAQQINVDHSGNPQLESGSPRETESDGDSGDDIEVLRVRTSRTVGALEGQDSVSVIMGTPQRPLSPSSPSRRRIHVVVSLRTVLLCASISILAVSVVCAVVPLSIGWMKTMQNLSKTAESSLDTELAALRTSVVTWAKGNITSKFKEPVDIIKQFQTSLMTQIHLLEQPLLIQDNHLPMHPLIKPVFDVFSKDFSNFNLGWKNSIGEHVMSVQKDLFGLFDEAFSSNVTYLMYNGTTPTTKRASKVTTNYNLRDRPWWVTACANDADLVWTDIYLSVIMQVNVISLTVKLRPTSLSVAPVMQTTMALYGLAQFFSEWNATSHGSAFLMDNRLNMVAGTKGITVQDSKGAIPANISSVSAVVDEWLIYTGGQKIATSFIFNDSIFVDVTPIEEEAGLLLWLVLLTPSEDFMGDLVAENKDSLANARLWMGIVVSIEAALGVLVFVLGLIFVAVIVHPLRKVVGQLKRVSDGDLDAASVKSGTQSKVLEISELEAQVLIMRNALDSFSKYIPSDAVKHLCRNSMIAEVGVHKRYCTIFFLDVSEFTKMMDQYGSSTVIPILHNLFERFSNVLAQNKAVIDKYIGDAIMAVWGALDNLDGAEGLACRAALEICEVLEKENVQYQKKLGLEIKIRIGIHSGLCWSGNVGCSHRLNYTVLGNSVNLAARLEPLNKELGSTICVSSAIRNASKGFVFRAVGSCPIRGFANPVLCHELLGMQEKLPQKAENIAKNFGFIDEALMQGLPLEKTSLSSYLEQNKSDLVAQRLLALLEQNKLF